MRLPMLPTPSSTTSQILTVVRRVLIVLFAVLVLVRPTWGSEPTRTRTTDLDVLVVVDRTRSMVAEDGPGNKPRLDQVKRDLRSLAGALPSVRFSAITFGGEVVRTELPFTHDTSAYSAWVDGLYTERTFDGVGSMVDAPLDAMKAALERDRETYPDRRRIVVFASDGENTRKGATQSSFSAIKPLCAGGLVLGYGSESGGRMRWDDDHPSEGYVKDTNGDEARSRIDLDNLHKIAGQMGLTMLHRTGTSTAPVTDAAAGWDSAKLTESSPDPDHAGVEHGWVFAFPLLPLLVWELWGHRRRAREAKEALS